jgi:hypothetical protein
VSATDGIRGRRHRSSSDPGSARKSLPARSDKTKGTHSEGASKERPSSVDTWMDRRTLELKLQSSQCNERMLLKDLRGRYNAF